MPGAPPGAGEEPTNPDVRSGAGDRQFSAHGESLFFEQRHLISPDVLRSEMIEPPLSLATKFFYRHQVSANRCFSVVAADEFFSHPLGELGHRELLSQ